MMAVEDHKITSEIAYDLFQEHMEVLLALDEPSPREQVIERVGSEKTLKRLLKHGLLCENGEGVRAASSRFRQLRQEGWISFLDRYVLPTLAKPDSDDDGSFATLVNLKLSLSIEKMRSFSAQANGMAEGNVQACIAELVRLGDVPAQSQAHRYTVLLVGTSNLLPEDLDDSDAALKHLQQACMQRSNASERELAFVTQFDSVADSTCYGAAVTAIDAFIESLAPVRANAGEASYHLTIATHWRGPAGTPTRQ